MSEKAAPLATPVGAGSPLKLVVVTGLSGAGKTTAVNALEDLGYFCVDNLPTPVVRATVEALHAGGERRVALGIDARVGRYLEGAREALDMLASLPGVHLRVLFLDASDELLARRFGTTRRPHPLSAATEAGPYLLEAVRLERELLSPLRARATLVIDSSELSVRELRSEVVEHFGKDAARREPRLLILSFGFKYGSPRDADLVLDVRFLPNPYFEDELRPLSGLDAPVVEFVERSGDAAGFLERCEELVRFCVPRYRAEGRSYVTIALGCTGGRHRSVALTERLANNLARDLGVEVRRAHRDLRRADHGQDPVAP